MADMTGRTIGNYQLIQYLARGDSSVVYEEEEEDPKIEIESKVVRLSELENE